MWRKVCRNVNIDTTTKKNSIEISQKLEIKQSYDPAIPPQGIYTEKTIIERDRCIPMFIADYSQKLGHRSNLNVHQKTNG